MCKKLNKAAICSNSKAMFSLRFPVHLLGLMEKHQQSHSSTIISFTATSLVNTTKHGVNNNIKILACQDFSGLFLSGGTPWHQDHNNPALEITWLLSSSLIYSFFWSSGPILSGDIANVEAHTLLPGVVFEILPDCILSSNSSMHMSWYPQKDGKSRWSSGISICGWKRLPHKLGVEFDN